MKMLETSYMNMPEVSVRSYKISILRKQVGLFSNRNRKRNELS